MTANHRIQAWRGLAVAALATVAASAPGLGCARPAPQTVAPAREVLHTEVLARSGNPELVARSHDWDWLVGRWTVKHKRLKARLAASTEWEEFSGASVVMLTMDGLGTVDDNLIELPSGSYRAVGIRAYDAKVAKWSIWWLDNRHADAIEPPVRGGFKDGAGIFEGDDTLNGKPIKVRFRWTQITPTSAHWDQAFSPDGGATWEFNWHMDFTRAP